MNEKEENICYICHDPKDNELVTLSCGHKFHYDCIFLTYKCNMNNNYNNSYTKRECPYCRSDGGYLSNKVGYLPVKNIHKNYNEYKNDVLNNNFKKWEIYLKSDKCFYILKTGRNSGKQCSKNKCNGGDFCKIHQKKMDEIKSDIKIIN